MNEKDRRIAELDEELAIVSTSIGASLHEDLHMFLPRAIQHAKHLLRSYVLVARLTCMTDISMIGKKVFATRERRISEDPESARPLRSILAMLATLTRSELEYCIELFNGEAAPVQTFQWGRSARSVRIDGPRLLADDGPEKVGVALSMEA